MGWGVIDTMTALQALAPALGGVEVGAIQRMSGGASQETWAFDLRLGKTPATAALANETLAGTAPATHPLAAESAPPLVQPLILRRAPRSGLRPDSLGAGLAAEYALLGAAAAAGVPVPRTVLLLRPEHGLGEGYVMQRLNGETLGRRIVNDERFAAARPQLARACGQALARIHALPAQVLPPLHAASPADEVTHYENWHARHGTLRPVFTLALQWLRTHLPPAADMTLVHGDFRNGNLMIDETGLVGVLDWELAHRGDPMQDLGWLCVNSWRFGRSELPVGGFGRREDLFAGYVQAGGRLDAQRVRFWEVMGTLKWGVMCDGMAQSWLDGTDRSVEKAAIGRRASETEIDLLALLSAEGRPAAGVAQ